jgi:hypothetical protein
VRLTALDPPLAPYHICALFIHAACSSPNRIGDIPLLDPEMRMFVVSDSGSGGEIGIELILIVELLMRTRHLFFLVQHVGSRVEFGM